MSLIDLPLELFQAIVTETVWAVGLQQALQLRLVSRMFDTQVQRAIYALPSFNSVARHLLPENLHLPRKMGLSMTTRLILSKMDTVDLKKTPLCIAINRAVAYLEAQFEHKEADSRRQYVEALAGEAARTLELNHIADCLVTTPDLLLDRLRWCRENKWTDWALTHPGIDLPRYPIDYLTPSSDLYTDSAPQDALIAALSTKHFQLAIQLLQGGVKATTKSPAFGVPLQVAARVGAQEFVQVIIDDLLRKGKEEVVNTPSIEDARRFILYGATVGGHEHIVRMVLDNPENNRERLGIGLGKSIMLAVENGYEDVASLLLRCRVPIPQREPVQNARLNLQRRELRFWQNLSQKAARHRCGDILRIALESTARLRRENDELFDEEIIV